MIYLDNAATGGFKPSAVLDSATNTMRYLLSNPTRSSHRLSLTGSKAVYNTRKTASQIFGTDVERVIFTKNCTEALNLAILGSDVCGKTVITTVYEHNSVLRPLFYLKSQGKIVLKILDCQREELPSSIENEIDDTTGLIVTSAISNVTGEILPVTEIAKVANKYSVPYVVDGAQAGGHISLNAVKQGISCIALAGHKGLYGLMGSGLLIIHPNYNVSPIIFGGTGTESLNTYQPQDYPEKLESGTQNLPAIVALNEGLKYSSVNLRSFSEILYNWTIWVKEELSNIKGVSVFSKNNPAGIVSFKLSNFTSGEVADVLNQEFDIATRGGLHCAPLIHKRLGTEEEGLVRASFSVQNTERELIAFISAVRKIAMR